MHDLEPIYQVQYLGDGGGGWSDVEKLSYDAKVPYPKHWKTRIVYIEAQPQVIEECKHSWTDESAANGWRSTCRLCPAEAAGSGQ